jgi:hypothetical protein
MLAIHHNFCRVHQTLRITPAMQAGLSICHGQFRSNDASFLSRILTGYHCRHGNEHGHHK